MSLLLLSILCYGFFFSSIFKSATKISVLTSLLFRYLSYSLSIFRSFSFSFVFWEDFVSLFYTLLFLFCSFLPELVSFLLLFFVISTYLSLSHRVLAPPWVLICAYHCIGFLQSQCYRLTSQSPNLLCLSPGIHQITFISPS